MPSPVSPPSSSIFRSKIAAKIHFGFTTSNRPTNHHRSVEIWTTTCIVTNFGRAALLDSQHQQMKQLDDDRHEQQWVLINPCNSGLTGCKLFPYFPKGGPVPKQKVESPIHRDWQPLGYVTQWGGMEVGTGMLYPTSVIDGLVHIYGGSKLQSELYWLRQSHWWKKYCCWNDPTMNVDHYDDDDDDEPCPVGHAVITSAGNGRLAHLYDRIVHTTPPFYNYNNTHKSLSSETLLLQCYDRALHQATRIPTTTENIFRGNGTATSTTINIAIPLLGSGARGFPVPVACQVAAESIATWLFGLNQNDTTKVCATTTNIPVQRHLYRHCSDDNDKNTNCRPPRIAPIDATYPNLPILPTQPRRHERIVFGLLDRTIAEQLADEITKQIG